MSVRTIARPYAKAVFDFALEKGTLDQWLQTLEFLALVAKDENVNKLFCRTHLATADMFINICEGHIDDHGRNLIKIMAENGRLKVLPEVKEIFEEYIVEQTNTVEAIVKSAKKLTSDEEAKIIASLEKRLARKVKLNCSLEEGLISGVVITIDDIVIDGSIRGKLKRMASVLQA